MNKLDSLRYRRITLLGTDIFIALVVGTVASTFHRNPNISLAALILLFACVTIMRVLFRVYNQVWRYASSREYLNVVLGDFFGGILYIAVSRLFFKETVPLMAFWDAVSIVTLFCLASLSARLCYQILYKRVKLKQALESEDESFSAEKVNVAVVGAGTNGFYLVNELLTNERSKFVPCFFIDNDREKIGNVVSGIKVLSDEDAPEKLRKNGINDIIIAISGASYEKRSELFDRYSKEGFSVKLYELPIIEGTAGSPMNAVYDTTKNPVIREFHIEDLLFREPIKINNEKTGSFYKDKTVLITGGGGSIGSEICRQLAKFELKRLVIFDIYENNAYDIQQELRLLYGDNLDVSVEISSVREARRVDEVMEQYLPDIIIHAAAHKHVPLMEHNCAEAVKNNVFGTFNVMNAAEKAGVKKFILISTDKAVNPTNIMGATKRVCEMLVQSRAESATEFTAVRFGNVLGSNGSVIPLFKRQIAGGGPITITDKRIIRYFMTIPEAAQLVLEAGSMAQNGELYVLDMGKPVKILKLAEDMIRLSGLKPYEDIEIKEIGLREGEKLYEELLVKTEKMDKTENDMIFIEHDRALGEDEISAKLEVLTEAVEEGSAEVVREALKKVVPTYSDPAEVNCEASASDEMKETDEKELVSVG